MTPQQKVTEVENVVSQIRTKSSLRQDASGWGLSSPNWGQSWVKGSVSPQTGLPEVSLPHQ